MTHEGVGSWQPCRPVGSRSTAAVSSAPPASAPCRSRASALLAACSSGRPAAGASSGGEPHVRLQRLRRGAEEGLRGVHGGLHEEDQGQGHDQRVGPQQLPGQDHQLPAGQPGRRVHLVRRLPHAVHRREGPRRRRQRRLGEDRQQLLRRAEEGVDGRGRQAVLRAELQLPVGLLLPEVAVAVERLGGPGDVRRARRALQEDEGQEHHPDRVHRQGPLARLRHVRLPEHAHQRLPVPRRPVRAQGGLELVAGDGGVRHLEGAAALLRPERRGAHLAGGRDEAREQAGRA